MKNFTSFADAGDYKALLQQALEIKANPYGYQHIGRNKTVGLIFFNPSLRTRLSSVKAAYNLGAQAWVLNAGADSWTLEMADGAVMNGGTQEHIKEAIAVMSQYCDVLGVRTFPTLKDREADYSEEVFNKILQYATVPVISLESATLHPLQSFADLITVAETKQKERVKVVLTWAPHVRALPQCVPNSFCDWFADIDWVDFVITHPEGYELDPIFTRGARIEYDQKKALEGADYVQAKNWSSYQRLRPGAAAPTAPGCSRPSTWPSPTTPSSCTACPCAATWKCPTPCSTRPTPSSSRKPATAPSPCKPCCTSC